MNLTVEQWTWVFAVLAFLVSLISIAVSIATSLRRQERDR